MPSKHHYILVEIAPREDFQPQDIAATVQGILRLSTPKVVSCQEVTATEAHAIQRYRKANIK